MNRETICLHVNFTISHVLMMYIRYLSHTAFTMSPSIPNSLNNSFGIKNLSLTSPQLVCYS